MKDLIAGNRERGFPPVEQWGAWNEPDLKENPLHKNRVRAVEFWEIAQSILGKLAKQHDCAHCTVVAGEFAYSPKFELDYTSAYASLLLCHPHGSYHCPKRYWNGLPAVWGFHDYHDLIERNSGDANEFMKYLREHGRIGKPQVFMSEAGVQLQAGGARETVLGELEVKTEAEAAEKRELQQKAAEEFLKLPTISPSIDRMYYYEYTAPSKVEQKEHEFDSGLLEVENSQRRERPAYCVLAYAKHVCPPTAETKSVRGIDGLGACDAVPSSIEVSGHVDPNGAKTFSYHFEYGSASTPVQNVQVKNGWASVEVHADLPVDVPGDGTCPAPISYRLVAENAQATADSSEATYTFSFED